MPTELTAVKLCSVIFTHWVSSLEFLKIIMHFKHTIVWFLGMQEQYISQLPLDIPKNDTWLPVRHIWAEVNYVSLGIKLCVSPPINVYTASSGEFEDGMLWARSSQILFQHLEDNFQGTSSNHFRHPLCKQLSLCYAAEIPSFIFISSWLNFYD